MFSILINFFGYMQKIVEKKVAKMYAKIHDKKEKNENLSNKNKSKIAKLL